MVEAVKNYSRHKGRKPFAYRCAGQSQSLKLIKTFKSCDDCQESTDNVIM